MTRTLRALAPALAAAALLFAAGPAAAFCGFYVARADTQLFNQASRVVLAWEDGRTVITMASDFRGEASEFALVVPVPTFIERDAIRVVDPAVISHLDAYTAPRLVEYHDPDPCMPLPVPSVAAGNVRQERAGATRGADALGVTVEAAYTVGEYDIVILSATQSDGLATWLTENGYRMPPGAAPVLGSYLRQGMRFFVARVNLGEQARLGFSFLRPLQVEYRSPRFMLPIRLGTVNADGPQEVFAFVLSRNGRVETTNYRTVRLPSGMDIPLFVRDDFGTFYRAMFDEAVRREDMRVAFLEYAWDMGWCDPCAADPLSATELRQLGATWVPEQAGGPVPPGRSGGIVPPQPQNTFVTRLHVRYDAEHFPEDLFLTETRDRTNFQGRYVLRYPWTGTATCPQAQEYRRSLPRRFTMEAQNLASLTGWTLEEIRRRMGEHGQPGGNTVR